GRPRGTRERAQRERRGAGRGQRAPPALLPHTPAAYAAVMRAVTFQAPGEVRVDERPDPQLQAPDDAIVRIEASGVCGSDLHIFHGRVKIDPGFVLGHEYVGTVVAAGDAVRSVAVGDRVLGCFQVACGTCRLCRAGSFHRCERSRTFGHGAA